MPVGGFGRGLDAVFNRWTEALRTVEDRLRFDLGLRATPHRWRTLRHRVTALRQQVDRSIAGQGARRSVTNDPGAPGATPTNAALHPTTAHRDLEDLLRANLSRARESARSIEETLRIVDPALAATAAALRYDIYECEHEVLRGFAAARARVAHVNLYVLVTSHLAARSPVEATRAALAGGAQMIQLREKDRPRAEVLALARELRAVTRTFGALFIVNDYVDIALLSGADGVHQGQDDLPVAEARRILGDEAIVGVSTHCREQAQRASLDGADYIGVGPIFPTRTKEHRAAVGVGFIEEARAATDLPAFAIGSVNRDSLAQVLDAGARRIAVCTGVIASADIEGAARWFRERLPEPVGAPGTGNPAP
ncbi:MAG: thiamine phosphate synthase [Planctomycetota bacterium]